VSKSQPIFWHHGMFLQPQHFQQSEDFVTSQVDFVKKNISPWLWGFTSLDVSAPAVTAKRIEIHQAELLFNDGTYAKLNDNAYVSQRSIEGIEVDPETPLTVYLALRNNSSFSDNVTKISDLNEVHTVKTRFFTMNDPSKVDDSYIHGDQALTQELTLKLELVLETEKHNFTEYSLIPCAQIALDGENLVLVNSYVPPCLNIQGSDQLSNQLKDLKDELVGRAIQLKNGQAVLGNNAIDANAFRYKMSLQALSRFVPRLAHEVNTSQLHPWNIYGGLRELAGEISTFTNDINLLGETSNGEKLLPDYTHDNIAQCFSSARQLINQLLNEISVGPQFMVEMVRQEQSFTTDIPKDFFEEKADFYLIINSKDDWDDYSQSFFTAAKLASKNTIDVLIERSLPGIGLIHTPTAPSGLPKKDHAHYIRIDVHDDEWQAVQRQQSLVLHWDEAPTELQIELVILKR
jgi:type VI secretion system protein ImpJ